MTPKLDTPGLRRLHAEATPGEWVAGRECVYVSTGHAVGDPDAPDTQIISCDQAVADLVAAMRNALPALLDAYEAVRALGVARAKRGAAQGALNRAIDAYYDASGANSGFTDSLRGEWMQARGEFFRGHDVWEVANSAVCNMADRMAKGGE